MTNPYLRGWDGGFVGQSIGARDGFQQFAALAEADRLDALVVDRWVPLDYPGAQRIAALMPVFFRERLQRYYCPLIPSSKVKICRKALSYAIVMRFKKDLSPLSRRRFYLLQAQALGRATGQVAQKLRAAAFAYSYYGKSTFDAMGDLNSPKILFQLHPYAPTIRRMYEQELKVAGPFGHDLLNEIEMVPFDDPFWEEITAGAIMADFIIVPSAFVRKTLLLAGVEDGRIAVVPYGVDVNQFRYGSGRTTEIFRFLFVGQLTGRKGVGYLIKAWKQAGLKDAELVFIGGDTSDRWLLMQMQTEGVRRLGYVPEAVLVEFYRSADLLVLPSLVEGFGLVLLEGLACGTPFLATRNTGAPDILQQGEVGFLVEPGDVDDLTDKLVWCYEHRDDLHRMRPHCRKVAEHFSWARFRAGIRAALGIPEPA